MVSESNAPAYNAQRKTLQLRLLTSRQPQTLSLLIATPRTDVAPDLHFVVLFTSFYQPPIPSVGFEPVQDSVSLKTDL